MKLFSRAPRLKASRSPQYIRPFSSTSVSLLRSSELTDSNFTSLRSDSSRLWSDIHSTAEFGKGTVYGSHTEQTGLSRLSLSKSDKQARDWFVKTTTDLGCEVRVDKIGNIFAVRKGLRNDIPPTFAGSHLDSQPNGGRFDGVLGVCAGVEMLRVLNDNWIETEGPIGVVNWTNEEGARWRKSMMGSGVWAGASPVEEIWDMKDTQGVSVRQALEDIGYEGEVEVGKDRFKMAGHFELHIEQGKVLERNEEAIAVVEGVQAYRWYTLTVEGREGHAGATAWEDRSDALRAATELLQIIYNTANENGGLATIGNIWVENGSVNTIPGKVIMTLDLRHHDDQELGKLCERIESTLSEVGKYFAVSKPKLAMKMDFASKAIKFNETAMKLVQKSAQNVVGSKEVRSMTSGAGHDSVNTNLHCPTAMIFVPCRDGVTHNPEEWCSQEDAKTGTDVLIESILRFDRTQSEGLPSID